MNIPEVTVKQLLEAGVHLGHKTLRWNPKMNKFIFGEKNSIHIIDLTKTVNVWRDLAGTGKARSEEHTSELQSQD